MSIFYSYNEAGASPIEYLRLWLLLNLFCEKVFFEPRFDHDSDQGYLNPSFVVVSADFDFPYQTKFPSFADSMLAWGLESSNMTFVRREISSLLFTYVDRGDAEVEYD